MEVAPRYTLLSLFTLFEIFTLFTLFKLPYTAKTLASMLIYCYKVRTLLDAGSLGFWAKLSLWMGGWYPLDCYDYWSTCGA